MLKSPSATNATTSAKKLPIILSYRKSRESSSMSSDETERFLKQWATTVPLPNGPGEGTLMAYGDLQKSVNSYLQTIRDESVELPLELRLSEEMQIYQARQMAVLEYCKF